MKNRSLMLLLFPLSVILNGQSITSKNQLKELDTKVEKLLKDYHAAGVAIAVIKEDKTIYAKGFGYRDVEQQLPVNTNTIFGIGSVTKSFTAAILGKLEGENKLNLSDRPSQHIHELEFATPIMNEAIQIKNILTHSTGLPRMSSESSCVLFQSNNKEDLIPRLKYLKPSTNVGEAFMYCNYMYTLAGVLGERVTGKNWATNLATLIFNPLGMKNTYADVTIANKQDNFSLGYAVEDTMPAEVLPEEITTRAPAGSIYSSVNDMAKWVNLWMNEGKYKNRQILPAAYITAAISPQQIVGGGPVARNTQEAHFMNYGYGWFNRDYKGYYKVEHSGGTSGYTSNVAFFPIENIGLVVLTNQTGSSLAYAITDLIIDELLMIEPTNDTLDIRFTNTNVIGPATTKTVINTKQKPTHDLVDLVGKYTHPGYGEITISLKEETLLAEFPFTTFRLEHQRDNVFFEHFTKEVPLAMWPFMELDFRVDNQNKINRLLINFEEPLVEFRRVITK